MCYNTHMWKGFGVTCVLVLAAILLFPTTVLSVDKTSFGQNGISQSVVRFSSAPGMPDPNDILDNVNKARVLSHLQPLRPNKKLAELAANRASDMAQGQYYAHRSPLGTYYYDLLPTYGINPDYSCENLDMTDHSDSNAILSDWSSSRKGHRECMLNSKLVEAGYATAPLTLVDANGHKTTTYVIVAIHATAI